MINEYSKGDQNESAVCPKPLYYDSYYYAGDDMLQELIREIFLTDKDSALVARLEQTAEGIQKIKDFLDTTIMDSLYLSASCVRTLISKFSYLWHAIIWNC